MYSRLDIQKIIVKQLQRMSDIMVSCLELTFGWKVQMQIA